jgi:hypothetical protein
MYQNITYFKMKILSYSLEVCFYLCFFWRIVGILEVEVSNFSKNRLTGAQVHG